MLGTFCLLIVRNVVWVRVWLNQWLAILFNISTALQVTTLVYAVLIQTLIRLMLAFTSTASSSVYSIFTMFIMFVSPGIAHAMDNFALTEPYLMLSVFGYSTHTRKYLRELHFLFEAGGREGQAIGKGYMCSFFLKD